MIADLLTALAYANLAASAAILAVLALRRPVRAQFGARAAYALWLAAPIAAAAVLVPRPGPATVLTQAPADNLADTAFQMILAAPAAVAQAAPSLNIPALAAAAWLAGAAAALALVIFAHWRGVSRFGVLTPSPVDPAILRAAHNGLGPALIGALKPRLVLPADFEQRFDAREQALVLAHERRHLEAGDTRINTLIVLFSCLNWFNPLVHIAAFYARVDQELACDAAVAASFPGERRTYAEALLKTQLANAPLPLGCYWPGGSSNLLSERLKMLAKPNPSQLRRLAGGTAIAALIAGAGLAAWAAGPDPVTSTPEDPMVLTAPEPAPMPELIQATSRTSQAAPAAAQAAPAQPAAARPTVSLTNAGGQAAQFNAAGVRRAIADKNLNGVLDNGGSPADIAAVLRAQLTGQPYESEREEAQSMSLFDLSDGGTLKEANPGPNGQRAISRLNADGQPTARIFVTADGQVGGVAAVMQRPAAGAAAPGGQPPPPTSQRIVPIPQ